MYCSDVNERGMVEDGEVKRQWKFRKSRKLLSVSKQAVLLSLSEGFTIGVAPTYVKVRVNYKLH